MIKTNCKHFYLWEKSSKMLFCKSFLNYFFKYRRIKSLCTQNVSSSSQAGHVAETVQKIPSYMMIADTFTDEDRKQKVIDSMIVLEDFISEEEEKCLCNEFEPYMKRLRYESDHWDDAIHGYRETERLKWNESNTKILNRVRELAFPKGKPQLKHVHILDLKEEGVIKPHVDSIRFCGNTITGLSLLTRCVMRLVHTEDKDSFVDVLLGRRSLYIMKDSARYDYTHEILGNENSIFKGEAIKKGRRVSIICRNEPS